MAEPTYVELHCHSAFSFLDGASLPEDLVDEAARLGYPALALTDHDGLYGAMAFARAARAAGIQPITGAELTLDDGSHLTVLVETAMGYANLCRLITTAYMDHPHEEPRLSLDALAERHDGLILLTGCRQGRLSQLVDAGRQAEARALLAWYREWFGLANVFVELQHHLVKGDTTRVRRLVALAREAGIGIVATGDVHYHVRARHELQDVLVAIRHRTTLDASHRLRRPNGEFFLQPAAVMARRFRDTPEALANTVWIAERCAGFDLTRDLAYRFPDYPAAPGETPDDVLAREATRTLEARYGDDPRAHARLAEELALVRKHGLAGFFLVYRDIMRLAEEVAAEVRGPRPAHALPPGRGSGSSVSSILCYLLGLSHIDPLRYDLFLGRFLNEELASVPDIDLDFPREIREQLIKRIYEVYGADHAALVCAFSTYRLRSAVRDVGKALGLPEPDLDRLAKLSEHGPASRLEAELERLPTFQDRLQQSRWRKLIELCNEISGLPRHVTQHVGGMVIASQPLNELVPVQPAAMDGRYICQWDKDSIDDARMIKIDFLALGMLSLVEECLDLIVRSGKSPVDLSRIDFSDPAVYDMIGQGDTLGVFQIESRAQIQTVLRTQPRSLEDLIVQVAIIRPGPITGGAVNPYIRQRRLMRRFGQARPRYDHPLLEPILRETHGVILYQEQVLEVAMRLAGFTAGQADSFRRAMSRKRSRAAMERFWAQFRDGAAGNGVPESVAKRVFAKLLGFAAYGFPKSHAAAFAVLAYQSAWLKRYHPVEFVAALLNNQPMGFYPPHVLVNDAQRHGVRLLRPDINRGMARAIVEQGSVRLGLVAVDGISEQTASAIVTERERHGPYRTLRDLLRRTHIDRDVLANLILVGACDDFGLRRRELLWQLGLLIPDRRVGVAGQPVVRQQSLDLPIEQDMVSLPARAAWEAMRDDYDLLGLSPDAHPLGLLRPLLPRNLLHAARLANGMDGQHVRIAGLVVCRQRPATAKGMLFLLLEDESGLANVIVHPSLYERRCLVIRGAPLVVVTGRLQLRGGTVNVFAPDIEAAPACERPDGPVRGRSPVCRGRDRACRPGRVVEAFCCAVARLPLRDAERVWVRVTMLRRPDVPASRRCLPGEAR